MEPSDRDKRRVLVVEDEEDLRRLLVHNLGVAGYDTRAARSGEEAVRLFHEFTPDAVLLDLMLPDISGTEVCRRIRTSGAKKQPVILIVTAKSEEIDRVVGFEVGADDYVVKPFSVRELMLRLDARFKTRDRKAEEAAAAGPGTPDAPWVPRRIQFGPLEIDTAGHHVYVGGEEVHVSALEMRLILFLVQSPGHVRSRRDLLTHVWGYQPDVTSRTVDTHVKRLRDKLGPAGALIQTVRGLGYRLADIRGGAAAPEPKPVYAPGRRPAR